jgi:hypothetical protein
LKKHYEPLPRSERLWLAVAAAVAALAVVSAALLPFARSGQAPYFASASLAQVQRCAELPPRAVRHACLREVAAASRSAAAQAVALADR